ncbi:MAG: radical SAM protein [Bacteroidota bacterium]
MAGHGPQTTDHGTATDRRPPTADVQTPHAGSTGATERRVPGTPYPVPTSREAGLADRLGDSDQRAGERRYRVKALWTTLQGEGFWAGRPAVFIRLVGCNMWSGYEVDRERDAARTGADCPHWCDTQFTKDGSVRLTAADLARAATEAGGPVRFCVLTGGEPLLQADAALIAALRAEGFTVACETNGTVRLGDAFGRANDGPDWVVCSPKLPADRLVLERCDELKLVVPDYRPEAYAPMVERVREHPEAGRLLWLQPEDGPRLAEATRLAVDLALADPRWRVSVQGHKILGVD